MYEAIAIAGEAGSGKTTIAKKTGGWLSWGVFGAGELFREWCRREGIDNIGAESASDEVHEEIDQLMVEKIMESRSVVEGRVAGLVAVVNNLPGVMKVLLVCEAEERYQRIWKRDVGKYRSLAEVRHATVQREGENLANFSIRYQRSYLDRSMYDMVIDTGIVPLKGSVEQIVAKVQR